MGACVKLQALSARLCYLLHSVVTVFYTTTVLDEPEYRILFLSLLGIIVEALFTILRRGGVESKWFSSSTFAFLAATVPSIWLLELDRLNTFTQQQVGNITDRYTNSSATTDWSAVSEAIQLPGVDVTVTLRRETWLELIKQSFLGFVIFGRWALPLGHINRNQLSLLLFVYFAMASDIMELFQLFEDRRVTCSPIIPYCVLGVWTLSLLQFVIVLTMTRNFRQSRPIQSLSFRSQRRSRRRGRAYGTSRKVRRSYSADESEPNCFLLGCLSSDVWSILVTLFLMDGPFLGIRLYVVLSLNVLGYNIIFFLIKNVLIVCLSVYRLAIIFSIVYNYTHDKDVEKSMKENNVQLS